MNDFKGRHYRGEVILWAVRWYCRYGIGDCEVEKMLCERGVNVDHTTIDRWVQHYAPKMERRLRWQYRPLSDATLIESTARPRTYIAPSTNWGT